MGRRDNKMGTIFRVSSDFIMESRNVGFMGKQFRGMLQRDILNVDDWRNCCQLNNTTVGE